MPRCANPWQSGHTKNVVMFPVRLRGGAPMAVGCRRENGGVKALYVLRPDSHQIMVWSMSRHSEKKVTLHQSPNYLNRVPELVYGGVDLAYMDGYVNQ